MKLSITELSVTAFIIFGLLRWECQWQSSRFPINWGWCTCCSFGITVPSALFQTFFTSVLVDPGMKKQISPIDELLSSGLEYGYPWTFLKVLISFLNDSSDRGHAALRDKRKHCPDSEKCFERFIEKRDFVSFCDAIFVNHFVATIRNLRTYSVILTKM